MAADDGIVLRIPLMDAEPPGAELFEFTAEELDEIVTAEVGGSALFAARFRENAARSLLLPRRDPGRRTPCGSSGSGPRSCWTWHGSTRGSP